MEGPLHPPLFTFFSLHHLHPLEGGSGGGYGRREVTIKDGGEVGWSLSTIRSMKAGPGSFEADDLKK